MRFWLELNQEKDYGQIPVLNQNGKAEFFIQGNLDNPNHTLYLNNFRKQEVGRLFSDGAGLIASFTIDVVNHSLVSVKKLNTPTANIFYLTQLKYIVTGSIKRGTYTFRSGIKSVASVQTIMGDRGGVLICDITKPEDVPFILLTSVLFTQWHVTPLKLPSFPPIGFEVNPN